MLSYAFAIILIIVPFADGGLRIFGWKEIALSKNSIEHIIRSAFTAKLFLGSLCFVSTVILGFVIFEDPMMKSMLALFGLSLLVNQLTIDWIYRGLDRIKEVIFLNSVSGILFLLFVIVAPYPDTPYAYPLALFFSNTIPVLWMLRRVEGVEGYFRKKTSTLKEAFSALKKSRHFLSVGLASKIFPNYPIILLGMFAIPETVAQFRYAHLFFVFGVSISIHLASTYFTKVSKSHMQDKAYAATTVIKIAMFSWLAVALMVALLFIPAQFVVNWLFSGGTEVRLYLALFLLILPFGFVNGLFREIMLSVDRGRRTTGFVVLSLTVGIFAATTLLKGFGINGLFVGIFAGEIIGCFLGLMLLFSIRRKNLICASANMMIN